MNVKMTHIDAARVMSRCFFHEMEIVEKTTSNGLGLLIKIQHCISDDDRVYQSPVGDRLMHLVLFQGKIYYIYVTDDQEKLAHQQDIAKKSFVKPYNWVRLETDTLVTSKYSGKVVGRQTSVLEGRAESLFLGVIDPVDVSIVPDTLLDADSDVASESGEITYGSEVVKAHKEAVGTKLSDMISADNLHAATAFFMNTEDTILSPFSLGGDSAYGHISLGVISEEIASSTPGAEFTEMLPVVAGTVIVRTFKVSNPFIEMINGGLLDENPIVVFEMLGASVRIEAGNLRFTPVTSV